MNRFIATEPLVDQMGGVKFIFDHAVHQSISIKNPEKLETILKIANDLTPHEISFLTDMLMDM